VTRLLPLAALLASVSAAPAADHSAKSAARPTNIVKTAAAAGQFKTLVSLLVAADLDDALKGDGPFVVFAPTDDAFAKLPKGTVDDLLKPENKAKLTTILTYHVITGKDRFNYDNAEVGTKYEYKTLNGTTVAITRGDGFVKVNDAKVVTQNVACANGSVQVIDRVLLPPAAKKNTIPAVAEKAGTFKTLLAALTAAELAEVLGGDGPFTVFAPTDEAFAKLPKGTVEKLLKPENRKQLVGVLTYHVVTGKLSAKELVKAEGAKTLQGGRVSVGISGGRVTVNQSGVTASDVAADNGVIHVIDAVLMPSH
jgi:transforming growth factor-beta-induced protein